MANPSPLNHPLCNTGEFALIIRRCPEVVRRNIRAGILPAVGRPARIHYSQAEKYGVPPVEAHAMLREIRSGLDAN